ncbi:uncharacterized protein Tco025E_07395 [Trypanosoma conorhini]|uniref:Uncharacterized protein n=1 Tax=Trypanosoma conorhini TaxID=83891 RepID=A0A3S5IRK5_9TRYP|nr:uncharacterized protein Tco025E_07395 [Trypanosoma conorhini]RNF07291.1 hypothetical protein Tco025E_07395 [Trypanosoma conorhini]
MVVTCLSGQVVRCRVDYGNGIIKPFLRGATSVYSREGVLLDLKPTDHIMFLFGDVHMTSGKLPLYAASQLQPTAVVPGIHVGSVVSFVLQQRVFSQGDLLAGARQGIQAAKVTMNDDASLSASSHCLSNSEWLRWREEQRRLEGLLRKSGRRSASAPHDTSLDSFSVMPIDF